MQAVAGGCAGRSVRSSVPVQVHYTASPVFADPADDPVPLRSGWYWRHVRIPVAVPGAARANGPPSPSRRPPGPTPARDGPDPARAYAVAALEAVESHCARRAAPDLDGGRSAAVQPRRRSASSTMARLRASCSPPARLRCPVRSGSSATTRFAGRPSHNEQAVDWARARARVAPDLPEGFAVMTVRIGQRPRPAVIASRNRRRASRPSPTVRPPRSARSPPSISPACPTSSRRPAASSPPAGCSYPASPASTADQASASR